MREFGLDRSLHAQIARELYEAEKSNRPIELLTEKYPSITQEDSYAIQQAGLKLRLADGAKVVGRKIGITSRGMMELLNCDTPDYGYLLANTLIPEGGACVLSGAFMSADRAEAGDIYTMEMDGFSGITLKFI